VSRRRKLAIAIAVFLIICLFYDANGTGEEVHSIVIAVWSIIKSLASIIEIMLNAVKAAVNAATS
jgi:hypothetical protein